MELEIEKTDVESTGPDSPPADGEEAASFRRPQINSCTAQTTISVASGQTVVVGGLITSGTDGDSQLFLLASAKIMDR